MNIHTMTVVLNHRFDIDLMALGKKLYLSILLSRFFVIIYGL